MKNILLVGLLVATTLFNLPTKAADFKASSFINGQWLVVSNNAAVTYTTTNNWFFSQRAQTNVLGGIVNTINTNLVNDSWAQDVYVDPLKDGGVNTNCAFIVTLGVTNIVFDTDPPLIPFSWVNPSGGFTTNYPALVVTPTVSCTNVTTFVFQRSCWGTNFGTTGGDKFTFSVTATGVTPAILATNPPSSFMTGTRRVRLLSVTTDNSTGSVGVMANVRLGQWLP